MPLLWLLLSAAQAAAGHPARDLQSYLSVAVHYATSSRTAAVREIRRWRPAQIGRAQADLRHRRGRLRVAPTAPDEIDFRAVEAAVLLHADAGLLALQSLSRAEVEVHLEASLELFRWARDARAKEPALAGLESTDPRDYFVAVAAAALAIGFPETARPFADEAVRAAPLDGEVHLLAGCVAASIAEEALLAHRDPEAAREREAAEEALRNALAIEPGLLEARLRLGKLLLDERRTIEAEPLLLEVDEGSSDDRRRYLARLFLGRVAERRGRSEAAVRLYRRALEAWPDSQSARLALACALERASGPVVSRELVAATLSASRRLDRAQDPWWAYPFGPPGLAQTTLERVWARALSR